MPFLARDKGHVEVVKPREGGRLSGVLMQRPLPLSAQFMAPLSGWAKKDMTKRLQDEPLRISYSTRLNLMKFLLILARLESNYDIK